MKKDIPPPTGINMLEDIHSMFIGFSIDLRERICEECAWSIPTFYRKMRGKDKISDANKNKVIPILSNAEKEKIIQVADDVINVVWNYCEKYRNDKGKRPGGLK